jgi:integrase
LAIPSRNAEGSRRKPHHVQRWIDGNKQIKSPTTQNDRISLISGVFSWAMAMGYVRGNPIQKMSRPTRRIRQEFLPPDTWQKVLDLATDETMRDWLTVMLSTGARTQEMLRMEAKHFQEGRFVFPMEDSKGKKRSRVIYLPPEALAIVERYAAKYPEGTLFRNSRGNPWDRNAIRCRFRRFKRKMKMPGLTATTLRHSFAHHRLTSGQDALTVAKLMGHVDTRMLATRYGHLDANADYMQSAANQIAFPAPPSTAPTPPA